MNDFSDSIQASYLACRRVSRQARSSFPAAFCLLPPPKCRAMHALYAFMRYSDDLADDPPKDRSPADALHRWREGLQSAIDGRVNVEKIDARGRAILPAVADTIRTFQIPPRTLFDVLDGVVMDCEPKVYETFAQLVVYCEHVASAVGLACLYVWGFSGPEAFGPSRSAGLALQMTNILRDLGEDAKRGRIYIPEEDVRACGYSGDELRRGIVNAGFHRLMELEFKRTEQFYREAAQLPQYLSSDAVGINGLMMATYRELFRAIQRNPADVFTRRIKVPRWKKLWLATKWTLYPKS